MRNTIINLIALTVYIITLMIQLTDNKIGDTGATSLSEALKSNTTLTKLNLGGEDKRRHTRHPSTIHSFPFSSHKQGTRLKEQEQNH